MAFEDRCSPSQANSPGPLPNGVPPTSPTSPKPHERNLKPYTCSTVTKYERTKSPTSLRISPNLAYVKPQPASPKDNSPVDQLSNLHNPIMYSPYYNPYLINALPIHPEYLRIYQQSQGMLPPVDVKPILIRQETSQRSHQVNGASPPRLEHNVTDNQTDLHFSISNILKPDFGLTAIRKTTHKKEGPKAGGPVHSILYKPYELARSAEESKASLDSSFEVKSLHERRNSEYLQNGTTSNHESPFKPAPLGSLCNTVSQIGTSKGFASKPAQNGSRNEVSKALSYASSRDDYASIRRPDSANSSISTSSSTVSSQQGVANGSDEQASKSGDGNPQWPAWVYCTRYSDRPSSGPRSRRSKKQKTPGVVQSPEDKRPRTAFSSAQLARLKHEFTENRYLNERRRQQLSAELGLNEAQIKIWFQNKRAKIKKSTGQKNPLALQLMAQGLYNHGTASCSEGEDDDISVA